eukprot:TRINITY_DN4726_c0_g1_i6.p2 TRINITY_DN4726_c0_g1~~TRINITY_DN4726_c0_g1_i6.p2  ORF type:complete len:162 (-),score=5.21 TRINITY_DN4726_c0_g1_i6:148-633(-)
MLVILLGNFCFGSNKKIYCFQFDYRSGFKFLGKFRQSGNILSVIGDMGTMLNAKSDYNSTTFVLTCRQPAMTTRLELIFNQIGKRFEYNSLQLYNQCQQLSELYLNFRESYTFFLVYKAFLQLSVCHDFSSTSAEQYMLNMQRCILFRVMFVFSQMWGVKF